MQNNFDAFIGILMRFFERLRRAPPWAYFSVSLILIAACFAATGNAADHILCAPSDESIAVCTRNWINSLGTSASAFIALLTAAFVFGQLRVARTQASIAVIPSLDRRLEQLADVYNLVQIIENEIYGTSTALSLLATKKKNGVSQESLYGEVDSFITNSHNCDVSRTALRGMRDDLRIDSDIRDVADDVLTDSFLSSIVSYRTLEVHLFPLKLNYVSLWDRQESYRKFIDKLSDLEDTFKEVQVRINRLISHRHTLVGMARKTSHIKSSILSGQE